MRHASEKFCIICANPALRGRYCLAHYRERHRQLAEKRGDDWKIPVKELNAPTEIACSRIECRGGARPCPYTSCRYHLSNDCAAWNGDLTALTESCALDVAEFGGLSLDEVGFLLGLTHSGVHTIERRALRRLAEKFGEDPDAALRAFSRDSGRGNRRKS
jgi:hypothetical protein